MARGDRFKQGLHFEKTAAPVVYTDALKMLIAWAVQRGLELYQWDEVAAFYGNTMDLPVVLQLPLGFNPWGDELRALDAPPIYATMAKGVPGIPQGSYLQYKDILPALAALDFQPAEADNCLFVHKSGDMATTLHVDDGILAVPTRVHAEQFWASTAWPRVRHET